MADEKEAKNRKTMIAIAIAVFVIIAGIGLAVWLLSGDDKPEPPTGPYENVTETADFNEQPGSVSISPEMIAMSRGPDGKITANVTISALFKPLRIQNVQVIGNSDLKLSATDCPGENEPLEAGSRCQVTIEYVEPANTNGGLPQIGIPGQNAAPAAAINPASLSVTGISKTLGGDDLTVEQTAPITGYDNAQPAFDPNTGPLGVSNAGDVAPNNIDPYGPVSPQYAQQPVVTNNAPPVDYSQPAVPPQQPRLSAKEQFMLARRQAVLGNITRRPAPQAPKSNGRSWTDIQVPSATSSLPQDTSRVVTMDRVITAVLVRPFDSRQTQQVVAQVDRNVYGSTGRTILIPRGSTVIGTMAGGADRVGVVWSQIIRPDGARFMFQGSGADAQGRAGVPGFVDNRYLRRFGAALLGTVLKVVPTVTSGAKEQPGSGVDIGGTGNSNARNTGAIVSDIVVADVNAALGPIIQQNAALPPIITVPAGTRLTIMPMMDLVLAPVERKTIVTPSYPRPMNGGAAAPSFQRNNGDQGNGQGNDIDLSNNQASDPSAYDVGQKLSGNVVSSPGSAPPWGSN